MKQAFRPWHTGEDKSKMIAWAELQAKGNEIILVEIRENVYRKDFIRVVFKTQTEKQKAYGLYDTHEAKALLSVLPKKYRPHVF